jgi:hypothetical protein
LRDGCFATCRALKKPRDLFFRVSQENFGLILEAISTDRQASGGKSKSNPRLHHRDLRCGSLHITARRKIEQPAIELI